MQVTGRDIKDEWIPSEVEYTRKNFDTIIKHIHTKEFSYNSKLYTYQLQILVQNENETHEELVTRIRHRLLTEIFVTDHDDYASIPSLPAPKQPQFVSILPYVQIACWHLPRRRDLNRFRQDLGVTHILTLLNQNEVNQS